MVFGIVVLGLLAIAGLIGLIKLGGQPVIGGFVILNGNLGFLGGVVMFFFLCDPCRLCSGFPY